MKLLGTFADKHGLTLVEILVVLGISAVLVVASLPIYSNLQSSAQVDESTTQLIQTLRTARQRSIARLNGVEHGIYILQTAEEDAYILYQGGSYAGRNQDYDRVVTLDAGINLTTTFGGNEVHFAGGTGTPNATGTIMLSHPSEGAKQILVNSIGTIEDA